MCALFKKFVNPAIDKYAWVGDEEQEVSNAKVSSAESEQKIYLYSTLSETAYILVYIDDLLHLYNSDNEEQKLLTQPHKCPPHPQLNVV